MRFNLGLRLRVTIGFAVMGCAIGFGFGGWLYVTSIELDQRLIEEALSAEVQDYRARLQRNPASLPPMTATVRGYLLGPERSEALPAGLRDLPPGRSQVLLEEASYLVAVEQVGDRTLYLLHNRSQVEQREHWLLVLILMRILVTSMLAAAGGWWLAGRVIAPVRELARRVRERQPDDLDTLFAEGLARDEVGELAQAFERYLARLRAFIARERAFSADASHELRTPLAVIQGAVEMLQVDTSLSPRAQTRVERIARAARGMADLTTTLLMLARERPGAALEVEPCPAAEVLREVVEQHRPLLSHKPVAVELDLLAQPRLPVVRPLLAIAIGNLVRNAFTYTETGRVKITLEAASCTVEDTGPGVPPQEVCCLFEHSDRVHRASRGAGIGLPLVKRIADRQGWRVTAENIEGSGARFRLIFQ